MGYGMGYVSAALECRAGRVVYFPGLAGHSGELPTHLLHPVRFVRDERRVLVSRIPVLLSQEAVAKSNLGAG